MANRQTIEPQLHLAIQAFDGREVAPLARFLDAVPYDAVLGDLLLEMATLTDRRMQVAATWLLKRAHEQGAMISVQQAAAMITLLAQVTQWEAKLHLLQLFATVPIPPTHVDRAFATFLELTHDENKFVRAWAYNGLYHLATAVPVLQDEVAVLLLQAQQTEAASIRARIRNAVKGSIWFPPKVRSV
ncbi:MAG: hypothetical protein KDE47_18605 [Caldilineaceae bacterium]|nr:hypothetical protein [Caldilineaceae bacterium]